MKIAVSIPLIGYAPFLQDRYNLLMRNLAGVNSLNRVRSISTAEEEYYDNNQELGVNSLNRVRSISTKNQNEY